MGVGSVIATFVTCILFNIILPSGDQGSDVYLMYNVITFKLGVTRELSGCRACYGKTEREIYYPNIKINEKNDCNGVCIQNEYFACGAYPTIVNNIIEHRTKKKCVNSISISIPFIQFYIL